MPRSLPFLKFFTDMGGTVPCRVHIGLLFFSSSLHIVGLIILQIDPSHIACVG